MTASAPAWPIVVKEARALLPVWALALAAIAASKIMPPQSRPFLTMLAYSLGVLALGASSMGHEYAHRTLPTLLSQPVSRRGLYWLKAGALVPMVLTLAVAFVWLSESLMFLMPVRITSENALRLAAERGRFETTLLLLPLAGGLLLAPWLTMVCRSALAGLIFSVALPATVFFAADVAGLDAGAGSLAVLALCGATGVLARHRFMRLEAFDSATAGIQLPTWSRAARARAGHPVWKLVGKELRLQQLTFVIVAVYVLVAAALLVFPARPEVRDVVFSVLTPIYAAMLTLIIGASASAEERQYGTLEWQMLLPISALRQWMVKLVVVFGLAILLGVGLPALFAMLSTDVGGPDRRVMALAVVVLTAVGVYFSSLCASSIRAAMISIAALPFVFMLLAAIGSAFQWTLAGTGVSGIRAIAIALALSAPVIVLLWLAFRNHRHPLPASDSVILHAGAIVGSVVLGGTAAAYVLFTFA